MRCQDCGAPWLPVRRGECSRCGSDAGAASQGARAESAEARAVMAVAEDAEAKLRAVEAERDALRRAVEAYRNDLTVTEQRRANAVAETIALRGAVEGRFGVLAQALLDAASRNRDVAAKSALIAASRQCDDALRAVLASHPTGAPDPTPNTGEAEDWQGLLSMRWTGDTTYPFVEDENANITGYGHQDKGAFAAAVNAYDEDCNGGPIPEEDQWTADSIAHQWVRPDDDGERLRPVAEGTPDAIPVTTLWGQR